MRQTWRWFGPNDTASVDDMLQSGVEGVVSALHHVPTGAIWTSEEIARRQSDIGRRRNGEASGLAWEVVESLPVSEDIKKQSGDWRDHIVNYRTSMDNLAAAGIEVICYNFMPVLDWTRTDLKWRLPHGGTCMRFDLIDFAAFDLFILARKDAQADYCDDVADRAKARFAAMSDEVKEGLARNVTCGLPGAAENLTLEGVRAHLSEYDGIDADMLRSNLIAFPGRSHADRRKRLGLQALLSSGRSRPSHCSACRG
jgi:mannonate dehydratase